MKIAYCVPAMYNPGGMERVLTEKVIFLSSLNQYDITIITTEQKGRPFYFPLSDGVKKVNFDINFDAHLNKNLIYKTIAHYRKLNQYKRMLENFLRENDIDICVSLCGKEIEFLTSLKDRSIKMAEFHFAKDFRKQFLLSKRKGILWEWIGNYRTWQLEKSTKKLYKLVVLTKSDKKEWEKTHDNVVQIYNPCPFETKQCSTVENKRVIAIGRLDAQKGFDYLIQAWTLVAQRFPDWSLDIFGQGEWHNMLERMIVEKHLESHVFIRGVTDDVQGEYLRSSIYVMTSRYEGFPMVLLEAISYGLPCVSFDCVSGPNEIIEDGVNGFLVPVGNIELLADRICSLIENQSLRIDMSKRAKESSKRFIFEPIMKQWVDLFDTIFESKCQHCSK